MNLKSSHTLIHKKQLVNKKESMLTKTSNHFSRNFKIPGAEKESLIAFKNFQPGSDMKIFGCSSHCTRGFDAGLPVTTPDPRCTFTAYFQRKRFVFI